jgi:hypothetical protein
MKILINTDDTPFGSNGLLHIIDGPNQAKFEDWCNWAVENDVFVSVDEIINSCQTIEIENADAQELEMVEREMRLNAATTAEDEVLRPAIAARKLHLGIAE